jgi:hypothetical protein
MPAVATRQRRLPAFGKDLLELRQKGLVLDPPEVFVSLDSWKWALSRARVVVSKDADPVELELCFVAGIAVWLGSVAARDADRTVRRHHPYDPRLSA